MLTVNQIIDLSNQGFSAEQIEYLNSLQQPETPATSATPPEDPTTGDAIKALSTQIAALSETVKAMQTVNAQRAQQQPAQKVTADSIIKDFFGKKEGR